MESDEEELNFYDEIEIEDMTWDATLQMYRYPCPCGDMFQVTLLELLSGDNVGICPTCSLMIKVIYDLENLPKSNETANNAGQTPITA